MGKILLFYKYVDILYPEQVRKWQEKLCKSLNLKGRVLIAHEGINGTIGGEPTDLEIYKQALNDHVLFGNIDFKESQGSQEDFPRMRIAVRHEITHLGLDPSVVKAKDGGIHLAPKDAHTLMEKAPKDLIVFDIRNNYETHIGTFKNGLKADITNFRELPDYIDKNEDLFKDKEVLMACTGGIRCERASAYLKSKNIAKKVYQIEGGIHRYAQQFPEGFFRGKNYVFDGRIGVRVNNDILGSCSLCKVAYDEYTNCINAQCNEQFIACPNCIKKYTYTCGPICHELVLNKKVIIRKMPKQSSLIMIKEH